MEEREGVLFIRLTDSSEGLDPEFGDSYWRALFDLDGRIVSASVFATQSRPLTQEAGSNLIRQFVAFINAANLS